MEQVDRDSQPYYQASSWAVVVLGDKVLLLGSWVSSCLIIGSLQVNGTL